MKQLEDENRRLKQLVADLTLDKTMLQDVLAFEWYYTQLESLHGAEDEESVESEEATPTA